MTQQRTTQSESLDTLHDFESVAQFERDYRLASGLLWLAMLSALGASFAHLARVFVAFETGATVTSGAPFIGFAAAVAVDVGLVSLARASSTLARAGVTRSLARYGVWGFAVISTYANGLAFSLALGDRAGALRAFATSESALVASAVLFAATLPLMVLFDSAVLDELARTHKEITESAKRQAVTALATSSSSASTPTPRAVATAPELVESEATASERVRLAMVAAPGASFREIGRAAGVSDATVRRYESAWRSSGVVSRDEQGRRVFGAQTSSRRAPLALVEASDGRLDAFEDAKRLEREAPAL